MRDIYGKYDSAFLLAGASDVTCAVMMLLMIPSLRFLRGRNVHEKIDTEDQKIQSAARTVSEVAPVSNQPVGEV